MEITVKIVKISLISHVSKILLKILTRRIEKKHKKKKAKQEILLDVISSGSEKDVARGMLLE